jgi:FkbH-like protein
LHDLVSEALQVRAAEGPESWAFTFLHEGETEAGRVTYQDLDRRARAVAMALAAACGRGERALLLFPPGLEFIAAFFGCLYSGVIAVPAQPPRSPRALPRLRGILADSRPAVVLTAGSALGGLRCWFEADAEMPAVHWLATDAIPAAGAEDWRSPRLDPGGLAFLQYTSGSTAEPKGVMVSHANLAHNLGLIAEACGHGPGSLFVSWLPVYHDLGLIGQVLQAVWAGAPCVLMAPAAFLKRPLRWLEAVSRYRATTSGAPDFAWDLCARKAEGADLSALDLSSWRVAFTGAEPVRAATLARFAAAFAGRGFRPAATYPCYGLAEATLMVSGGQPATPPRVAAFDAAALAQGKVEEWGGAEDAAPAALCTLVGCGPALGDQRVVIVDPQTALPLPPHRIGEIWVAGPSVGQGYWQRPQATAATFGARTGSGDGPFLRTGDLGFLHAGELFIAGRSKDLILLRGRNLYPQDVEHTAAASHPDLRPGGGAAFTVEGTEAERLVLVHEVVRHPRGEVEEIAAAIRAAVSEELEASVAEVVLIRPETLPRTSSGKVRRQECRRAYLQEELRVVGRSALGERAGEVLEDAEPDRAASHEALLALPGGERRAALAELIRRRAAAVLGLAAAGVPADLPLSRLGLDSLGAAELAHGLERALGVALPVADLLADGGPDVLAGRLLDRLDPARDRSDDPEMPEIAAFLPAPGAAAPPASFEQERLWFLDQLRPGDPAYNLPAVVGLGGRLDRGALAASLGEAVRRHASLRTTFGVEQGRPVQRVAEASAVDLPIWDLAALPSPRRAAEAGRLAAAEAQRPFDLARGPLLRAGLLGLGGEEHRLLLTVHHAVCDLGSLQQVIEEVTADYAGRVSGMPVPVGPLPVQFADFAAWQRRRLRPEILAPRLDFWRRQLAGIAALDLPADRPRAPGQAARVSGQRDFSLPAPLTDALRELARGEGATLFMALLALFQALLHLWTGEDDFVVGCPVAGRPRPELLPVVGFFAHPLPLRADLSGEPTLRQLLGRVRRAALAAYAHQEVPFAKLAAVARPDRPAAGAETAPLFQVMLGHLDRPLLARRLPGLAVEPLSLGHGVVDCDLFLTFARRGAGLDAHLGYDGRRFAAATMDLWVESFGALARRAIEAPDAPLSRFAAELGIAAQARAARQRADRCIVAVAATFTAEPVAESLGFWLRELGLPARLRFAPYGQVLPQLLDPLSLFARNPLGLNVVLVRAEDWGDAAERQTGELAAALQAAAERFRVPCLVVVTPASPAARAGRGAAALAGLEERLATGLTGRLGVELVTAGELAALYPVASCHAAHGEELGHIPYTDELFAALGTLIARRLFRRLAEPVKVLALDCDQTLWKGVCGEDGPLGVEIDPPHRAVQELALARHRAGLLLCLLSRNNEEDVAAVFARRPEMALGREHIVASRIDWRPKADNLRALAEELGLGLDSFLVLDDDPVVCAELQAACPEALVVQLPEVAAEIPRFLDHLWALDPRPATAEDTERTRLYREEQKRERLRSAAASFADFLAGLGLVVSFPELTAERLPRVAQLTQRTNQLNVTTLRRNEGEIRELCGAGGAEPLLVEVRDRLGAYGLVGVVFHRPAGDALRVDTLLLSCRALGRGVEHRVVARLGEIARERRLACVEIPFRPTRKNRPALDFLNQIGEPFRQPLADGWLFALPAAVAASVAFTPDAPPPAPPPATPALPALAASPEHAADAAAPAADAITAAPAACAVTAAPAASAVTAAPVHPALPADTAASVIAADAAAPASLPAATLGGARRTALARRIARELATAAEVLAAARAARAVRPGMASGYVAPRTPTEERLAELWRQLLGVERVGVEDHFFDLGGHSLLAMQVLSRVRESFGVEVPLSALFDNAPTVANLARTISRLEVERAESGEIAALLGELEEMTEEQVLTLLASESAR